LSKRFTKTS